MMDKQLWNVFYETGDPICYILCKNVKSRVEMESDSGSQPEAKPVSNE